MEAKDVSWKGVHISQLQTSLNRYQFPALVASEDHTILFRIPISPENIPECFPSIFKKRDFWDSNHVKLSCSEKNVTREKVNRWNLIRNALTTRITSSQQLQAAILTYNSRYAEQWNFTSLHSFFDLVLDEMETVMFFETLLPKIIDLALRFPELITGGIPLLKRDHRCSVSLSQLQISCLLSNAFLCTFPHRNSCKKDAEYFDYPDINFNRLFQCYDNTRIQCVHEKLKCILNYFRRVTSKVPTGVVTYTRQSVSNNLFPNWCRSNKKLPKLFVSSEGTIEDDGFGFFQVDFANKFVGGGVIGNGCVQEEIRFVICPELILSRLFTQCLGENEALVITGCERFNKYKGYGTSFEWDGNYVDGTPSDEYGRKYCTVIALDALSFQNPADQYSTKNILRDLNKAFVGFSWGNRRKKEELCAIATGNWGCGAFRGDPELKSFLQLMAAGEVGRDLAYFTFGDLELRDGMAAVHTFLVENEVTIGKLFNLLSEYNSKQMFKTIRLFQYIRQEALKNPVDVEMANRTHTTHKPNHSDGSRQLEITKKRSFCYRTKLSDWFSPASKTSSSNSNNKEPKLDPSTVASEMQTLTNFYKTPTTDPSIASNSTDSTEKDSFEFLNTFKESLKRKRLSKGIDNSHKSGEKETGTEVCARGSTENVAQTIVQSGPYSQDSCLAEEMATAEYEDDVESSLKNSFCSLTTNSEHIEPFESVDSGEMPVPRVNAVDQTTEAKDTSHNSSVLAASSPSESVAASTCSAICDELDSEKSEVNYSNSDNGPDKEAIGDERDSTGSVIKEIEKENLRENSLDTPSAVASYSRPQSNISKRVSPKVSPSFSSKKFPFSSRLSPVNPNESKKRKISDYFSSKVEQ